MTIFVVANQKGGVGKSTTSVQLATGIALAGYRPWLVDSDPKQPSALLSLTNRMNAGLPGIPGTSLTDGASLLQQVKLQAPNYDHTIIDVGAKDSGALRAALMLGDVVLIPFAPKAYEVWAHDEMMALVKETQVLRPHIKVVPFLNMTKSDDPKNSVNASAIADVEALGVPVCPFMLGMRVAIERASAAGLHVSEYRPLDTKAVEEVSKIVDYILHVAQETLESPQ